MRADARIAMIRLDERQAFRLGSLLVDPLLRRLSKGADAVTIEPRVMQVLVVLAEARGDVVTRDQLIASAWSGRIVEGNAIDRAISRLRALSRQFDQPFTIETITRVGYRLHECAAQQSVVAASTLPTFVPPVDRRALLAGLGVAAVAVGGAGLLWQAGSDRRAARRLLNQGLETMSRGADQYTQAADQLEAAVRADPDYAPAWIALARVHRAGADSGFGLPSRALAAAERAYTLAPRNRDALAIRALAAPIFRNWTDKERWLARCEDEGIRSTQLTAERALLLLNQGDWRGAIVRYRAVAAAEPRVPWWQLGIARCLWCQSRHEPAAALLRVASEGFPRNPVLPSERALVLALSRQYRAALDVISAAHALPLPPLPWPQEAALWLGNALSDPFARQDAAAAIVAARRKGVIASFIALPLLLALQAYAPALAIAQDYYLGKRDPGTGRRRLTIDGGLRVTYFLFAPIAAPLWNDRQWLALFARIGISDAPR